MTPANTFDHIVTSRRSVRLFDPDQSVPAEVIRRSLDRAVLSPNSSNLQLWEFYWLRDPEIRAQMGAICLGQNAAKTAQELVVIVVRKDLWRQRCAAVLDRQIAHFKDAFGEPFTPTQLRVLVYWQRYIPILYRSGFGLLDFGKWVMANLRGLTSPMTREVTATALAQSAHRSVALAAMTFIHSLTAEGFDTCPMEGFDSRRLKRLLALPRGADISMVIAIGKGLPKGVYGPRLRLPTETVVFEV
jgi:nitroreductase